MNIFYLDHDPSIAAVYHCDKHVVKMIIEYCQLLSTAHRLLDGEVYTELSDNGRRIKRWKLSDDRESILYKASHINHPSAIWVRQSAENYGWLVSLLENLLAEYTHRYGKHHASERLLWSLKFKPKKIATSKFTEPPQAMPEYCKIPGNSVAAYQNYYLKEKVRFAKWTNRNCPSWWDIYNPINIKTTRTENDTEKTLASNRGKTRTS